MLRKKNTVTTIMEKSIISTSQIIFGNCLMVIRVVSNMNFVNFKCAVVTWLHGFVVSNT